MGRLSDAMGAIFLGYATLHHFQRNRNIAGLETLAESALLQLEVEAQVMSAPPPRRCEASTALCSQLRHYCLRECSCVAAMRCSQS